MVGIVNDALDVAQQGGVEQRRCQQAGEEEQKTYGIVAPEESSQM